MPLFIDCEESKPIELLHFKVCLISRFRSVVLVPTPPPTPLTIEGCGISSGLCVGGPTDEGFSRPIELSAAPADTPYPTLHCAALLIPSVQS